MKVAIIGAGNVGTALAGSLTRAGHEVVISSRDPQDAVAAAPASSLADLAAELGSAVDGTPFIGVSNRMAFDATGPSMDTSNSNAEELAARLPATPIVKAFNTLFASKQAAPTAEGVQLDGYVAGDDAAAKGTVLELVESIGLRPVDVGPLVRARQLESLAFLNIALNATNDGAWQSGWVLVGAPDTADRKAA